MTIPAPEARPSHTAATAPNIGDSNNKYIWASHIDDPFVSANIFHRPPDYVFPNRIRTFGDLAFVLEWGAESLYLDENQTAKAKALLDKHLLPKKDVPKPHLHAV